LKFSEIIWDVDLTRYLSQHWSYWSTVIVNYLLRLTVYLDKCLELVMSTFPFSVIENVSFLLLIIKKECYVIFYPNKTGTFLFFFCAYANLSKTQPFVSISNRNVKWRSVFVSKSNLNKHFSTKSESYISLDKKRDNAVFDQLSYLNNILMVEKCTVCCILPFQMHFKWFSCGKNYSKWQCFAF
jgi:hypothetical protein